LGWLAAGGVCYTLGTAFLILDVQRYHFHAIWHLWVIAGSSCHFLSVLFFVASLAVAA
jgi:hemolysin III